MVVGLTLESICLGGHRQLSPLRGWDAQDACVEVPVTAGFAVFTKTLNDVYCFGWLNVGDGWRSV